MTPRSTTAPAADANAPATVRNIQALRGIAALLVLWAHLKLVTDTLNPTARNLSWIYSSHGAIGVDLFFIISGYVICLTACKRHLRPLDFFLARMARVSPLNYVAFVLALVIRHFSPDLPFPLHRLWMGIFYLPVLNLSQFYSPPLIVGWTLSFEMWFYVVFALLLVFWKPARVVVILPSLFFVGALLMTFYHGHWYFPRFMFHPFVLEFAMGCLLFHFQRWLSARLAWILLIGGVAYTLVFARHTGYLGYHLPLLNTDPDLAWLRVLLWGVPSAFVAAGLLGLERAQGLILPSLLVWAGDISYSLYLSHEFTMTMIENLGPRVGLHDTYLAAPVVIAICLLFGWLCWMWIEKPLTRWAQAWVKPRAGIRTRPESKPITAEPMPDVLPS